MEKKKKIFEDHTKQGKKLVPPLLTIGNFTEASYVDLVIPEIIWIALLINKYGVQNGTAIALEVVSVTSKTVHNSSLLFSFISSFESLEQKEKEEINSTLANSGSLKLIQDCLVNFITIYPECPLNFLVKSVPKVENNIKEIKSILISLYDKTSIISTFSMGNVVYHMGVLGVLNVGKDSALGKLPQLIEYPKSSLSKIIASSIRASIHVLIQPPFFNPSGNWNKYFWNQGVNLESSKI